MKIDDIMSMWGEDHPIDETELGIESGRVPNLHAKYLKELTAEKYNLGRMKYQQKKLKRVLYEYYSGDLNDPDSLEEIDREPWMKKVLKNELDVYIDSDKDMIEMNLKVVMQEEKVNYLDSVMRHLNNRGYLIRQMIDWAKFTHG